MDNRRMCPQCRAFITAKDRVCPYCNEEVGARAIDQRSPADVLGGLIPQNRFATVMILVVNVGLYVASVLYSMSSGNAGAFMDLDAQTLFRFGAKYPPSVLGGEWWRLVTAGFLHGGLIHIGMNSWVLYDLGAQVEELFGSSRFMVFYLVATIGGFAASTFWSPAISVGASAGMFGLIGVMIALGIQSRTAMGEAIRGMYIRWAVYGLLFGLLPYFHVDNAAHIGGLAGGFACGYLAGVPGTVRVARETVWIWAGRVSVAVILYCFFRMYLSFANVPQ
ncbi:MAG: rhomboid family intramembrane serine protease [Bryobacteraceae bacterium]